MIVVRPTHPDGAAHAGLGLLTTADLLAQLASQTGLVAQAIIGSGTTASPVSIPVAADSIVGRLTGGNVASLTPAQVRALLDVLTTAQVDSRITAAFDALVGAAPGALDTLIELAAALGNDPNFATTVTNALAGKASTTDPRLSDQRVPTDGSVTDIKVAANAAIAQSKVAGLVTDLAAKETPAGAQSKANAAQAAAIAASQPLDSDLTAIAALTTTAFGRALLTMADAAATRAAIAAASDVVDATTGTGSLRTLGTGPLQAAAGTDPRLSDQRVPIDGSVTAAKVTAGGLPQSSVANLVADLAAKQPLDSDLTAIAALNTTGFGRALLEVADAQATRIAIGVNRWPERYPANSGQDYNGNSVEGGTLVGNAPAGVGTLIAGGPLWSGPGFTISLLDAYFNVAGSAGAVYRMGVWLIDSLTDPFAWTIGTQYATLLLDGGTVDGVTTGRKLVTVSAVIPAGRWFVVGGVQQVATSTPTVATSQNGFCPSGQANVASGVFSNRRWPGMTGITGALPNLTPNTALNTGHGVGFRRA